MFTSFLKRKSKFSKTKTRTRNKSLRHCSLHWDLLYYAVDLTGPLPCRAGPDWSVRVTWSLFVNTIMWSGARWGGDLVTVLWSRQVALLHWALNLHLGRLGALYIGCHGGPGYSVLLLHLKSGKNLPVFCHKTSETASSGNSLTKGLKRYKVRIMISN